LNKLEKRRAKDNTAVLDRLFKKARKPVAMDVWSNAVEGVKAKIQGALEAHTDWHADLSPQQTISLRRRVKKRLFNELPEEEQERWEEMAKEAKNFVPDAYVSSHLLTYANFGVIAKIFGTRYPLFSAQYATSFSKSLILVVWF
jgi:pyruvate-formate lyase-activating enzyme